MSIEPQTYYNAVVLRVTRQVKLTNPSLEQWVGIRDFSPTCDCAWVTTPVRTTLHEKAVEIRQSDVCNNTRLNSLIENCQRKWNSLSRPSRGQGLYLLYVRARPFLSPSARVHRRLQLLLRSKSTKSLRLTACTLFTRCCVCRFRESSRCSARFVPQHLHRIPGYSGRCLENLGVSTACVHDSWRYGQNSPRRVVAAKTCDADAAQRRRVGGANCRRSELHQIANARTVRIATAASSSLSY